MKNNPSLIWFKDVDYEEVGLVGQKGVSLGEIMALGLNVPNGFCLTTRAYSQFLKKTGLVPKIRLLLGGLEISHRPSVINCSQQIEDLIFSAKIPDDIVRPTIRFYNRMGNFFRDQTVAVRASPVNERLKVESLINIKGEANLIEAIKQCWASLFSPENMVKRRYLLAETLAVLIQEMLQPQLKGTVRPKGKTGLTIKSSSPLTLKEKAMIEKVILKIRRHYFFPQETEFALVKGRLYILKTQPYEKQN